MRMVLQLDLSVSEALKVLSLHAPRNSWHGLRQSLSEFGNLSYAWEPYERKRRVWFTGERTFVVEFAYGICCLKGSMRPREGGCMVEVQSTDALPMKIVKWLPAFAGPYMLVLLLVFGGQAFGYLGVALWIVGWYGFVALAKRRALKAEGALFAFVRGMFEGHITSK